MSEKDDTNVNAEQQPNEMNPSVEKKNNNTDKPRYRKTRKRKKVPSDDDNDDLDSEKESEIDLSLEKKLRECARRNNLSPLEVKKLLRKIVGNDHVLALVKLQEEEQIKDDRLNTPSKASDFSDSDNRSENAQQESMPKLTRSKAKALNRKPVSLPSLTEIEPEPEVTALFTEEINTDDEDEDEEYEPKEEDYMNSEDDFNTTVSDIDSQPRTPLTNPHYCSETESPIVTTQPTPPKLSNDGVFKIPRERTVSGLTREDEIIAKRTRSKLCLETTPIETIESTFVPPDITTDMYEIDHEVDQEWMEFLNEFTKPLNNTTVAEEDDPEADPEYVAADKVPIDAEELKNVNISKKELNDLVAELFDGLIKEGVILDDIPDIETPKKTTLERNYHQRSATKSPCKKKTKFSIESQPIFTSPSCERFAENPFPMPGAATGEEMNCTANETHNTCDSTTFLHQNVSAFVPNIMSTPALNANAARVSIIPTSPRVPATPTIASNFANSIQSHFLPSQSSTAVVNSVPTDARVCSFETNSNYLKSATNPISIQTSPSFGSQVMQQSTKTSRSPTEERTVTLIAYPMQGGPPCYKVVPLSSLSLMGPSQLQAPIIATIENAHPIASNHVIDLTTENLQLTDHGRTKRCAYRTKAGYLSHPDIFEMWRGDAHKSAEKYYKTLYKQKYQQLAVMQPKSQNLNQDCAKTGFTAHQRQILDQQMRMHVQLLTQNYIQTYSHPQFWPKAESQKDFLLELERNCDGNANSAFNAWNLKESLKLISNWEEDLAKQSDENQKFIDFIYHQLERCERNKRPKSNFVLRFAPKIMKTILQSNVFMYPELLPRLPYRNSGHPDYHDHAPIESHLLSFELEKYLPSVIEQIKKEHRKNNSVRLACDKIAYDIMTGKSGRRLHDFYKQELISEDYNPIKYFQDHKVAPPFQHILQPIDFDCVRPPIKRRCLLPMLWMEFAKELEASELMPNGEYALDEIAWTERHEASDKKDEKREKQRREKRKEKQRESKNGRGSQNVVINLNYVLDNPNQLDINVQENAGGIELQHNTAAVTKIERRTSTTDYSEIFTKVHEPLDIKFNDDASYLQHLNIQGARRNEMENDMTVTTTTNENFNYHFSSSRTNHVIATEVSECQSSPKVGQKRLTDYFTPSSQQAGSANNSQQSNGSWNDLAKAFSSSSRLLGGVETSKAQSEQQKRIVKLFKQQNQGLRFSLRRCRYGFRSFKIVKRLKERKRLQSKLKNMFIRYWKYLHLMCNKFKSILLRKCFIHFKKMEIYSDFLELLKQVCRNAFTKENEEVADESSQKTVTETARDVQHLFEPVEQTKSCDEAEMLAEQVINANNFFEKVEQKLFEHGKQIKFRKFLSILKAFDPDVHTTVWLYNKMEKLFLPECPELAEAFLYFMLPAETSEASHYFRTYMLSNRESFVEALVGYFDNYQAKSNDVYECLKSLSANDCEPTTLTIKESLCRVLDGDDFLTKWSNQIFIEENINVADGSTEPHLPHLISTSLKFEARDLVADESELQSFELKYINARLNSIAKVILPEKLAALAKSLVNENVVASIRPESETQIDQILDINQMEILLSNDSDPKFENIKDLIENINLGELSGPLQLSTGSENVLCELRQGDDKPPLEKNIIQSALVSSETIKEGSFELRQEMPDLLQPVIANDHNSNANRRSEKQKSAQHRKTRTSARKRTPKPTELESPEQLEQKVETFSDSGQIAENKPKTTKKSIAQRKVKNARASGESLPVVSVNPDYALESTECKSNVGTKCVPQEWTRDEDRIIMEEARLDYDTNDDLVQNILMKLEGRTYAEIEERYSFLMDLLSQLKNS